MQGYHIINLGWRKTMEDADIHSCDIGDGNAIFGIFDGHGGNLLLECKDMK